MSSQPHQPEESDKPAPTLYVIIAMKLLKGVSFITIAISLYALSDNNLPAEYQNAVLQLSHWNHHVNPEGKFWVNLANQVGHVTERGMLKAALGTLMYSMFAVVESVGLMFRVPWAGWLSIGESAFFVPIEMYDLVEHFRWTVLLIMLFNIAVVWYLYQNRKRLFHHHHHHHHHRSPH